MILDRINIPADLRKIPEEELPQLCDELRAFVQENTSQKEGHIRSSFGVTELSVALHYLLNTPVDILIWDVGHQAYIHKVLTGRKNSFHTNREPGGLSGFTSRQESEYDPFGAGHSSTSISAAAGFAMADKLRGNTSRKVVSVIGDGAMTGGMSFEALNHIGEEKLDVLIILNDNHSSIDDNRGALAERESYDQYARALGIEYLGECDGHDMSKLLTTLRAALQVSGPRILKVNTIKSKGYIGSVAQKSSIPDFQEVCANTLTELAAENEKIIVISPAMLAGGGLHKFAERFLGRCVDVGIAEQHAVTFAAGLAADGMIPVVHLYSTFAQRAYDQIIHDVALQDLHVIFVIDRAGLVGADGSTHHGVFDPGFFNTVPNLRITAPMNSGILRETITGALDLPGPHIIRIPKDRLHPALEDQQPDQLGDGVFRLRKGKGIAVISFGILAGNVQEALKELNYSHYNFNQLKPLPGQPLKEIASNYRVLVTIEENSARGALGDSIRAFLAAEEITTRVISHTLPDRFVGHASRTELLARNGLDTESLSKLLASVGQ